MYTRILADTLNPHECGIDCVPTADGRHILYPALPTIDAGRYQWELNRGMTRAQYRASGQDETRECRVWSAQRAAQISADLQECDMIAEVFNARRAARRRERNSLRCWEDDLIGGFWAECVARGAVADRAAARRALYLSGRESSQDEGRGL